MALAACNRAVTPVEVPEVLRVSPIITKATDVDFEDGDRIGMTVLKGSEAYAVNIPMTYSGGVFSGEIKWYSESETEAVLAAYYPYSDAAVPVSFTVAADQSRGIGSSDLIAGSKSGVRPTKNVVDMVFRHQLTKLHITICNASGGKISAVTLGGSVPTASVDIISGTVEADKSVPASDIRACEVVSDTVWTAIVVPQTVAFDFKVTLASGKVLTQKLKELTVEQSFQYAISAVVYDDDIKIVTSGQIRAWLDGGDIPGGDDPSVEFEEHLEDGYFIYHNVRYPVAKMADGRWWMAGNMRYVPAGLSPCDDLENVTAGIYYPLKVNESQTAVEFTRDADVIESSGYLYQSETALGIAVGSLESIEQVKALEGAKGICPKGWHIPTGAELVALVGKIAQYPYPEGSSEKDGAYYDSAIGNASAALLNADGFDAGAWGAVSINDNTRTSGSLMGWIKANPSRITSGFVCGSSYASSTPLDPADPEAGFKNFQFWGLMPMTGNGTYNGAKLNYRAAATVRCIRDSR